jgi:hypothetical protein
MSHWLPGAIGIGRPAEADPPRRPHIRYLRGTSFHLTPWSSRFRFGWVLGWNGLFWHNAAGVKGPDWDNGNWLGGSSWRRGVGPVAVCRWRRRGSLRSDIQFERNMGCHCQHIIVKWFQGRGHVRHMVLCARLEENERAAAAAARETALAEWEDAAEAAHRDTPGKPLLTAARLITAGDKLARLMRDTY